MDDYRGFLLPIFISVGAVETPRQVEIKLDCSHLPEPTKRILHQYVNLRPIESPISFLNDIIPHTYPLIQNPPERSFCLIPRFQVSYIPFRSRAQAQGILETKEIVE